MQDILIRNLLLITGIRTDPKLLEPVLPGFANGQMLKQVGRGSSSRVYCGHISRVYLPDPSRRIIAIDCIHLFEKRRGDPNNPSEWIMTEDIGDPISFEFDWFRLPQKPSERHPIPKLKLERTANDTRCWLCPETDPAHLELFRLSIRRMICAESFESRAAQRLLRRLRVRLLS
jgi:hypothetical protein